LLIPPVFEVSTNVILEGPEKNGFEISISKNFYSTGIILPALASASY